MLRVTDFFPRPISDLGNIYAQRNTSTDWMHNPGFVRITVRLALVAAQLFLYYHQEVSAAKVTLIGAALSLPSTVLVAGGGLFYFTKMRALQSRSSAFICFAAGWFLLDRHDVVQLGFIERFLPQERAALPRLPVPVPQAEEKWIEAYRYENKMGQKNLIRKLKREWTELGRHQHFERSEDISEGIFQDKTIRDSGGLGTQKVVEFFYCYTNMINDSGFAKDQGSKITGGNKQQVYYACFDNTFIQSFVCDGVTWASREHYFQAQKFIEGSETYRSIQEASGDFADAQCLREVVRELKYENDLRLTSKEDWNIWHQTESKLILIHANFAYFAQNQEVRRVLLSTDKMPVIQRCENPSRFGISFRDGVEELSFEENVGGNLQGWILMYLRHQFCMRQT